MMYNLENLSGFFVVMVIECSVASGKLKFGGKGGVVGCEKEKGCYLNCFP